MPPRAPLADLPTHEVTNMPPYIGDQDLWSGDAALRDWCAVAGAQEHAAHMARAGADAGREEVFDLAEQANRHGPELRAFDRYGMRLNAVTFHPAYHALMQRAMAAKLHNFAWAHEGQGGHAGQAALTYIFAQPEGGVLCPMAMTYSAVPALRAQPEVAEEWLPRILSDDYDARDIPASEKRSALVGMFMTEKQGGSDVRANSTRARPAGSATGGGAPYLLSGHKFFCSAPMCDAFLVLAQTGTGGPSCFLVPRWRPDGSRNALLMQRLKDKLGNRSNASSEMEFDATHGVMLGEEGRGIRTIIDMVIGNRIYCAMASAGLMRQSLVQAMHHTRHRRAFQKRLVDQPLMANVLADLALETEAALALGMRVARAMDAQDDPREAALARLGTALAKYWNCKRAPAVVGEALECHGGPGYVEDSIMPRLFRESPLNAIWEGSSNILALDLRRAFERESGVGEVFLGELAPARGHAPALDAALDMLEAALRGGLPGEGEMRRIAGDMALCWQAALLLRHAPGAVAEAFCAARFAPRALATFGTLPQGCDIDGILHRALGDHP